MLGICFFHLGRRIHCGAGLGRGKGGCRLRKNFSKPNNDVMKKTHPPLRLCGAITARGVEGVSHQSARKKGLLPAPRRVNRRRHRPLPVSTSRFLTAGSQPVQPASFFPLKNWHHPSHPFHDSQKFLLICSDTTDPFYGAQMLGRAR